MHPVNFRIGNDFGGACLRRCGQGKRESLSLADGREMK